MPRILGPESDHLAKALEASPLLTTEQLADLGGLGQQIGHMQFLQGLAAPNEDKVPNHRGDLANEAWRSRVAADEERLEKFKDKFRQLGHDVERTKHWTIFNEDYFLKKLIVRQSQDFIKQLELKQARKVTQSNN